MLLLHVPDDDASSAASLPLQAQPGGSVMKLMLHCSQGLLDILLARNSISSSCCSLIECFMKLVDDSVIHASCGKDTQ